jgi:hypothetical protein
MRREVVPAMSVDDEGPITPRAPPDPRVEMSDTTNGYGHVAHGEPEPDYDAMSPEHLLKLATVCARQAANSALSADAKASEALRAVDGVRLELTAVGTRLASDIGDIARAVGAKRTYSGQVHVSIPPSVSIRTSPSKTGSQIVVDPDELRRFERMFADKEAEERGAREALEEQRQEYERQEQARARAAAEARTVAEERRKNITIMISIAGTLLTAFSVAVGYLAHH